MQPSLLVIDLIHDIATMMASSTLQYQLDAPTPEMVYVAHEALPLNLLEIHDRGRTASEYTYARLRCSALQQQWSVSDLAGHRRRFANPELAIEGNRFVVHLGMFCNLRSRRRSPGLTFAQVTASEPLTFIKDGVLHTCIAKKVYNGFDDDRMSSELVAEVRCTCVEDMDTVLVSDESDREETHHELVVVRGTRVPDHLC